jgi:hypothetical protein
MRRQFSHGLSGSIIELDYDCSRLCGTGGADYPYLFWQTHLAISPANNPQIDYAFRILEAQLFLQPAGMKIADARPVIVNRVAYGFEDYKGNELINLEFPLDSKRIEVIENNRNGGSVKFRFDVQVHVDEYAPVLAPAESKRPTLWSLRRAQQLSFQEAIEISQTQWISSVLPGLGYGKVHVLEFPAAPLASCAGLDHSFKALNQAIDAHRQGRYDDAAGKCRVALDPFFDYVDQDQLDGTKRKIPIVKKVWQTRVGEHTYIWLNETLGVLKAAANPSHHSPNSHFDQIESQMLIAVVAAVVNYAARVEFQKT